MGLGLLHHLQEFAAESLCKATTRMFMGSLAGRQAVRSVFSDFEGPKVPPPLSPVSGPRLKASR